MATWRCNFHKKMYQLDHWVVRRRDLCRVRSAGRLGGLSGGSDHDPIAISLNIARRLRKQIPKAEKKVRIDRARLQHDFQRSQFRCQVRRRVRDAWCAVADGLEDECNMDWLRAVVRLGDRNETSSTFAIMKIGGFKRYFEN